MFSRECGLADQVLSTRELRNVTFCAGKKKEIPIAVSERRCSAVGLAGDWLDFAFLRVRECLRGETV